MMRYQKQHKWVVIISVFIGLLIGFFIGRYQRSLLILNFNNEFQIFDLLGFVVSIATLGVALQISTVVERNKQKELNIFSYIQKKIELIEQSIFELNKLINKKGRIKVTDLTSLGKKISQRYFLLEDFMKYSKIKISDEHKEDILSYINHIKNLSTEDKRYVFGTRTVAYKENEELKAEDGFILILEEVRRDLIEESCNELMNSIHKLVTE